MYLNNRIINWVRRGQFLAAIIIYLFFALVPNPQEFIPMDYSDHALHALGNFLLLVSTWLTMIGTRRPVLWALVIAVPFSLFVEAAQGLTATRTPDYRDLLANGTGIAVGVILCLGLQRLTAFRKLISGTDV